MRWRIVADVKAPIETGLANASGNTDVSRDCRNGNDRGDSDNDGGNQKSFHVESPVEFLLGGS